MIFLFFLSFRFCRYTTCALLREARGEKVFMGWKASVELTLFARI